jgi:hypothetical protein
MIIDWTDLLDYYDKVEFKPWIKYLLYFVKQGEEIGG